MSTHFQGWEGIKTVYTGGWQSKAERTAQSTLNAGYNKQYLSVHVISEHMYQTVCVSLVRVVTKV